MTESPLTLTIDIGTSSTRVLLWDSAGHEVEGVRAQIPYQMHTTPDGGVEMPAEEFLHYVGDCIDQALAQAGCMPPHHSSESDGERCSSPEITGGQTLTQDAYDLR